MSKIASGKKTHSTNRKTKKNRSYLDRRRERNAKILEYMRSLIPDRYCRFCGKDATAFHEHTERTKDLNFLTTYIYHCDACKALGLLDDRTKLHEIATRGNPRDQQEIRFTQNGNFRPKPDPNRGVLFFN